LRVDSDKIFLRDGRFFTSAGVTAAIDLALWLIEADHGRQLAIDVARELVVYLKRSGGQEQYSSPLQLQSLSGNLEPLMAWIAGNLTRSLSVEALAERAHLSPRQLHRRFVAAFGQPIGEVIERLRLDAARERLTEYAYPIEAIARAVGFRSADVFRRAFVRRYGTRPSDYRDRFDNSADRKGP
jgi:transcriptional regulator GlxA family with amidase domain